MAGSPALRHRLYFDEDSAESDLIADLRRRGYDCVTAVEAGMLRAPDDRVLFFAAAERRIVITANQGDYFGISSDVLHSGGSHAGIIVVPQRLDVGEKVRRLHRLLTELSVETMRDRVEFLTNWPEG